MRLLACAWLRAESAIARYPQLAEARRRAIRMGDVERIIRLTCSMGRCYRARPTSILN